MNWLLAHAYVVFVALIGFTLIAGGVVLRETSRPSSSSVTQWGRTGGVMFWNSPQVASQSDQTPPHDATTQQQPTFSFIPIRRQDEVASDNPGTLPDEWQSLLSALTQKATAPDKEIEPTTDAYNFIQQGLISVPDTTEQKTEFQKELFEYGNRVGVLVRAFDESHTSMISTLKDAYEDRGNTAKREAAVRIGTDYIQLGKDVEALAEIPSAVNSMHRAIARSYQAIGEKMILKLNATSDEEFVTAMHTYNASALEFTNNFVALASYLSGSGVRFSTGDPGSIFTFRSM